MGWLDGTVRRCDEFLAITGEYWFEKTDGSEFSHWRPRLTRLDLAVDRSQYPLVKESFNPPGRRRFLYIGNTALTKNTAYLSALAGTMHGAEFGWIGSGEDSIKHVTPLGFQRFETAAAKELVAKYDFLITVGRVDANPTTILESMAWGLIPVCTPQSGYEGNPGIVNVPLDDLRGAVRVLEGLQATDDSHLRELQALNLRQLDEHFNWDRFTADVTAAIERTGRPHLPSERLATRMALASYYLASPYSPYLPRFVRLGISRRAERGYVAGWTP